MSQNSELPFFLKSPHFLISNSKDSSHLLHFQVSVDPLTITDMSSGFIYQNGEVVVEDSSGERMHLFTSDGCYRLDIPYYGTFPPFHGYFVTRRYVKDEDVWECVKFGQFVALPTEK